MKEAGHQVVKAATSSVTRSRVTANTPASSLVGKPRRHRVQLHINNYEPTPCVELTVQQNAFSDEKGRAHSEEVSFSSSSGDSVSSAPPRLVPGHRMWANRNGRHILGLIEDYNALRKQISEGRRLSRCMDKQLQESLHALKQQPSDNKVPGAAAVFSLFVKTDEIQKALLFLYFHSA